MSEITHYCQQSVTVNTDYVCRFAMKNNFWLCRMNSFGTAGLSLSEPKFKSIMNFLISNFHRILNIVCFLLGNFPASQFYMPTFRNTLSVPSS